MLPRTELCGTCTLNGDFGEAGIYLERAPDFVGGGDSSGCMLPCRTVASQYHSRETFLAFAECTRLSIQETGTRM
jgi:hypothetical protein